MVKARELHFNMFEWHHIYNEIKDKSPAYIHAIRKKYFKGGAFNLAFPFMGVESRYAWSLSGVLKTTEGGEYEFDWQPDGILTFTEFMKGSAYTWSNAMNEIAGGEEVIAIDCVARVG